MTVPEQPDTLMHRPMSSTAQRIREQVATVNPEFMNSLKYYLNHVEDPTKHERLINDEQVKRYTYLACFGS
ncbi:hypothetical protein O0I10_008017 [Lichtheimia ornata]|uniref:Uncharacterized protein n=1 Tax=Lichtheimia ornata TaxID=688661 RepID=A0AAD7UYX7_9FUNG|nr:uncharacterized protein O0I10_008017 [Lichtheimia ornata]KAJ8656223.1 hypothetical protein O0I10_008017 [Lichtheimia ornata]